MDKEILSVEASVKEIGLQTQNFSLKKRLKGTRIFDNCIRCALLVAYLFTNPVNNFSITCPAYTLIGMGLL